MAKPTKNYAAIPPFVSDSDVEYGRQYSSANSATSMHRSPWRTRVWTVAAILGVTLLICSMTRKCGISPLQPSNNSTSNETTFMANFTPELEGRAKDQTLQSDEKQTSPVPLGPRGPPPTDPLLSSQSSHTRSSDTMKRDKPHHHHHHHHNHQHSSDSDDGSHSKSNSDSDGGSFSSDSGDEQHPESHNGWVSSLHSWWRGSTSNDGDDQEDNQEDNKQHEKEEEEVIVVEHAPKANSSAHNEKEDADDRGE